ncbi:hypothetical protein GCM10009037_26840 [Halarchaeum grantii]|uniref:DEAD/DEAH box helicase n=1 Tax=Halarchaeum grantii TaxID=1193105 RepID=A0A830EYD0_9EURY|nr:DEAD/DEAH box helicase [Halarchaeum grantii]GGL41919.1 hypothetical protein GCM10009037_26840 [Halarchaeum grantii]
MKFFDRHSDLSRVSNEFEPKLRRILYNRRIFSPSQDDPPYVTQSVKYEAQPKHRALPVDGDLPPFSSRVLQNVFEFDTPYRFQQRAWEAINDAIDDSSTEGVLLTAPTGQGKTDAFTAPLLQKLCGGTDTDQVAMVYPRTALLEDQFERLLETLSELNSNGNDLSIGVYFGSTARNKGDVIDENKLVNQRNDQFQLASCWEEDGVDSSSLLVEKDGGGYRITCENPDHDHSFSDEEVVLYREGIRSNGVEPDIIITTLESLEMFSLKPNYGIIQNIDALVFDEVHLYRGLYGAHAMNIIKNIQRISELHQTNSPLWIGSSATLANPTQFGKRLFNITDSSSIEVIRSLSPEETEQSEEPDMEEASGVEHYQFLRTTDDTGVGSHFIQQSMLYGHHILPEQDKSAKMLSFIDSLSQINQRYGQLRDADVDQRMWEHHFQGNDRAWDGLEPDYAWDSPNAVMESLNIDKAHSRSRVRPDELAASDMILASPLLEVGIDISDIRAVAQYRPPWNASSFIQRIGRAGREPDENSFVMMFLASSPNDLNLYYRASRFLESDIRTPLNENNRVIESIHDNLWKFYETGWEFEKPGQKSLTPGDDKRFLRRFLVDVLEYDQFFDFIFSPGDEISRIVGHSIGRLDRPITKGKGYHEVLNKLEDEQSSIREELNIDDDRGFVQQSDSFEKISDTLDYIISEYIGVLNEMSGSGERIENADEALSNAQTEYTNADNLPLVEGDKKVDLFRKAAGHLRNISTELTMMADLGPTTRKRVQGLDEEVFEALNDINSLKAKLDSDQFDTLHKQSRQIYYLKKSLEAFEDYCFTFYAFYSIYAAKSLFRSAYYFNRALNTTGESLDDEVYFVPEDYFGNNSASVTISRGGDYVEEDKTSLFSQYAPYRAMYADSGQRMVVIEPDFDPHEDRPRLDFTSIAEGETDNNIFEPESIKATVINDASGRHSQGIVKFCPVCYDLLTDNDTCSKHSERQFGKIHSDPYISTEFGDLPNIESEESRYGNLIRRSGEGRIMLEKIDLEITPAFYLGDRFIPQYGQQYEIPIESRDPKLGVTLPTEGIELDLSETLSEIRESTEMWEDKIIGDRVVGIEEVVLHTASHFFLVLIADISGINPRDLHYGYRTQNENEDLSSDWIDNVYVFEQAEGGQGIVDLLTDELNEDGIHRIISSLERVAFNEQLEAERFCRNRANLEKITPDQDTPISDSDLTTAVDDFLAGRNVVAPERLQEELRSIVRKICRMDDNYNISRDELIDVKVNLVESRFQGESIDSAMQEHASVYPPELQNEIEASLCPPDIDECRNNLQFSGCQAENQSEVLSYEILRELVSRMIEGGSPTEGLFGYDV